MKQQIIILLGIILLTSCTNSKKTENEECTAISTAFLENVKTVKVVLSNKEQELLLTGKVECDPDKIISFVPLVSGVVVNSYFSLGDKVRRGQPLLDIRSTELSALQSEKIALEADEKVAERELKTAQSLFDDNMISEKELLEAKGKLQQIRAAINKIKADMSVYGTDKGNGIFAVHAPMSGFIVHKKASSGSVITSEGDPVFTIADLSTVWVIANVYAGNLQSVREGMEVEMTSFSYPDEKFYGKINAISQVFDPEERVLKARIVMNNKDLKLKPEMSMLITLKDKTSVPLLAIPSDALIFDNDQYFVVVEESVGNFAIRNVILQGDNNQTAYIASGLQEGEKVVITNHLLIYSGLKEE
jgi:cobalt-zinc-cadmium efflux system membrane fusion protein